MPEPLVPAASSAPRPRPRWHRSLYWRVGISLIALVALMLAAEGALFLYLSDRTAGAMPARNPQDMARLVASDVSTALRDNPTLDLDKFLPEQYGHFFQTILVVLDGRVFANHDDVPADEARAALMLLGRGRRGRGGFGGPPPQGFDGRGFNPRGPALGDGRERPQVIDPRLDNRDPSRERGPGQGGPGREGEPRDGQPGGNPGNAGAPPPDRGPGPDGPRFPPGGGFDGRRRSPPPPPFPGEWSTIVVNGAPRGVAAIMPGDPPFSRIVRLLGPTMGLVASGVLIVGGSIIALLVFGPARQRLLQVQTATERLGTGDLLARAPEHGGDEIAALAGSFNRMAEELTRRAQALESSDKARRQLLADVSHELMTPLTAMRGYIETLGMPDLPLDPPTRERYMRIVTEETHRLEHIIGDLLDLARLEGGGTTMRREIVPLEDVFDRVAERHERELSARHIELERVIEPAADRVIGDPDRLEQALQNLVANALRFTPDEGRITLSTARRDDGVRITVRDTGSGIPADHLPQVFDRFYKVDASRKATGGSGLGLSIVKAIIERHGGTISARNDDGAVFEIGLPDGNQDSSPRGPSDSPPVSPVLTP